MMDSANLALRLAIWFLLTSDGSLANIVIGVVVALAIPGRPRILARPREWFKSLKAVLVAIPQAYIEAVEIIVSPHNYEETVLQQVPAGRSPGLVFLDIFLITFTPKTIVSRYHRGGWYEIHQIRRHQP